MDGIALTWIFKAAEINAILPFISLQMHNKHILTLTWLDLAITFFLTGRNICWLGMILHCHGDPCTIWLKVSPIHDMNIMVLNYFPRKSFFNQFFSRPVQIAWSSYLHFNTLSVHLWQKFRIHISWSIAASNTKRHQGFTQFLCKKWLQDIAPCGCVYRSRLWSRLLVTNGHYVLISVHSYLLFKAC